MYEIYFTRICRSLRSFGRTYQIINNDYLWAKEYDRFSPLLFCDISMINLNYFNINHSDTHNFKKFNASTHQGNCTLHHYPQS